MVAEARRAQEILSKQGVQASLVNARFVKPFDDVLLADIVNTHQHVFVLAESAPDGGLGQRIQAWALGKSVKAKIHSLALPDRFVTHGGRDQLLTEVGLSAGEIARFVLDTAK